MLCMVIVRISYITESEMKSLILIRLLKIWLLFTHVALPMGPSGVVRSKVHNLDFSYSSDASSQKMVAIELVVFKKLEM